MLQIGFDGTKEWSEMMVMRRVIYRSGIWSARSLTDS